MNNKIKIIEVSEPKHVERFLQLPEGIPGDKNWIRPLDKDIEQVFDPNKTAFIATASSLGGSQCVETLVLAELRLLSTSERPTVLSNQPEAWVFRMHSLTDIAFSLFDTCRDWLKEFGIGAMDGPINFGENNAWWGLVVEGYEPPLYRNNYNPSYYQGVL